MRLNDVMDDVAARLRSVQAFETVWGYPPGSINRTPSAIVSYPESYNPHGTYSRGAFEIAGLEVHVVVGLASERSSREALSKFLSGPGPGDLVTVLEADGYTAFDVLTVSRVEFGAVDIGGTRYVEAIFICDIVGSGA